MKRLILVLVVVAAIGAGVWVLIGRSGGADAAAGPATVLDAEHTLALAVVADLAGWAQDGERFVRSLPAGAAAEMEALLDPALRQSRLGFDPVDPAGWASIGLAPEPGIAVVADARVRAPDGTPRPIWAARVRDRSRLLAWLSAREGRPVTVGQTVGRTELATVEGSAWSWVVGQRGDFTLGLPVEGDPAADRAALEVVLGSPGPVLATHPPFDKAFRGAEAPLRAYGYLSARGGASLLGLPTGGKLEEAVTFYGAYFPAAAAYLSASASGARLVASEDGLKVLEQLFRPRKAAPDFARYVPARGWSATRVSGNLVDAFDGIGALLPPGTPASVRGQLGMAKAFLPMVVGFAWDELTAAFSGHALVATELATLGGEPAATRWLILLAVQTPDRADALMARVSQHAKGKISDLATAPVEVDGRKGHSVRIGPFQGVAVRDGEVVVAAPDAAAVSAALARARDESLAGRPHAKVLEGDVIFGTVTDLGGVLDRLRETPSVNVVLSAELLAKFREEPVVAASLRLDRAGLLFADETARRLPAGAVMGVILGLLAPALQD